MRFATWDMTATSEDFPYSGCSNSMLSPNRKLFGVASAREGIGRGSPMGNLSRLLGCSWLSKSGGGNPGFKSDPVLSDLKDTISLWHDEMKMHDALLVHCNYQVLKVLG